MTSARRMDSGDVPRAEMAVAVVGLLVSVGVAHEAGSGPLDVPVGFWAVFVGEEVKRRRR